MPIKVFEFTSIEARRFSSSTEKHRNIRIDHNSTVTQIIEINDQEASIDYRFTANYSGIGLIKIEGKIIYTGNASELAKKWSSSGQMPENAAQEIHTTIMNNCIPEAMMLSRDLRLPPPVPMPAVNVGKKGAAKPSSGIEVA